MQDAIEVIKVEQETKRSLAGRVQELEAQLAVDPSEREAQLTSALEEVCRESCNQFIRFGMAFGLLAHAKLQQHDAAP